MKKPYLNTSASIAGELRELTAPERVRIPLHEKHKAVVKRRQVIAKGQIIAENPTTKVHDVGFVHACKDGAIEEVLPHCIVIGPLPEPKEGEAPPELSHPEPTALDQLEGNELCRKLLELGIDTSLFRPGRTLIINGLNPEPGMLSSEYLLRKKKEVLEAGVRLLKRAVRPETIKLAAAQGKDAALQGCATVHVSDLYPATIDPLVVHALTGMEHPEKVDIISVSQLYQIGRTAQTGLPVSDTVLSLNEHMFQVPIGMPVQDLLTAAGVVPAPGWKIALGGPMRGEAISDLSTGVPQNCTAITFVQKGEFPEVEPNPCIYCGECVLVCPARIHPGTLSARAEFGFFDTARAEHVEACLECGMCTFVCPAHRPVLQYLMTAKRHLAVQDEILSSCRLQE